MSEGGAGLPLRRIAGWGFFRGLRYPLRGLRFVYVEHRGLARFWIWPILLTFLCMAGSVYGALGAHDAIMDAIWETPTGDGWGDVALRYLHDFVEFLLTIIVMAAGLLLSVVLSSILAAPFNDLLSEEVERIATGQGGVPFSIRVILRDLFRTIRLEIGKLALYLSVMIPLFVLQWAVPGVGAILYSAFAFGFSALFFAVDYVDWPATRRGWRVRDRIAFARGHKFTMLGFGTCVWAFLFVPVLNLFFMPAAVAGGTLLFLDRVGPRDAANSLPE